MFFNGTSFGVILDYIYHMSQEAVERFLGRLLTDDDFRDYAGQSFARACMEEGFHLTEEESRIIKSLDFNRFILLSKKLDGNIKRSVLRF